MYCEVFINVFAGKRYTDIISEETEAKRYAIDTISLHLSPSILHGIAKK